MQVSAAPLRWRPVVDRLTAGQIAERTGWSSQYVRERLRDHGIALRPPGTAPSAGQLTRADAQSWADRGASVAQISAATGYSQAGIYQLFRRHGLPLPPRATPPVDPHTAALIRRYVDDRQSLATIGAAYDRSEDWVVARLHRAGVQIRRPGRQTMIEPHRVRALLDDGLRVADIAEQLSVSPTTVLAVIREHGWTRPPPRPRGPTRNAPPPPAAALLHKLYVTEGRSISAIAAELDVSRARVRAALGAAGVPVDRPGYRGGQAPPVITAEQLAELYTPGRTVRDVADALGTTATRVNAALRRHGIPRRPEHRTIPPLDVDAAALADLYVDQRLDDAAIAERFRVPTHRVTLRRRQLGIRRPAAAPPTTATPAPPPGEDLVRLYTDEGLTLYQISRRYRTSSPVVHRWLTAAGVSVQPRTTRASRARLDPNLLKTLYVDHGWTAAIAADQHTTAHRVLRTLHEHDIPVRRGGSARRRPTPTPAPDPRLTALYSDPDEPPCCADTGFPRGRSQARSPTDSPARVRLTPAFLRAAYQDIGLAAIQIEQLTGHPHEQILDQLHAARIPIRAGSRLSPWLARHRDQD